MSDEAWTDDNDAPVEGEGIMYATPGPEDLERLERLLAAVRDVPVTSSNDPEAEREMGGLAVALLSAGRPRFTQENLAGTIDLLLSLSTTITLITLVHVGGVMPFMREGDVEASFKATSKGLRMQGDETP